MKTMWRSGTLVVGAGVAIALCAAVAAAAVAPRVSYVRNPAVAAGGQAAVNTPPAPEKEKVVHVPTPAQVRGIYMTQCAAGTMSFRENLMKLLDTTELNSIVIDIRDYSGGIAFPTNHPSLKDMVSSECGARDMKDFVKQLHDKGIYVIGRITVFQNPVYTKLHPEQAVQKKCAHSTGSTNSPRAGSGTCGVWKDYKGLAFVDVGAKEYWSTVVDLSKESYELGFDELNYDYIRFPSDGDMKSTVYSFGAGKSKQEALEEFFKYLHEQVKPLGVVMSADLFGMVTTNYDDLNIGQVLERTLPYFDYIDPMVYPSHYPTGFNGYKNVNEHSYDIVLYSMKEAVRRTVSTTTSIGSFAYTRIGTSTPAVYEKPSYPTSKMRPWLQSFDYPVEYTPAMVRAQIQANTDAGLNTYLFWDAANKYRSLRVVLSPQE